MLPRDTCKKKIFLKCKAGLNWGFSFSYSVYLTKAKEYSLPCYLLIARGRANGSMSFPRIQAWEWNENKLVQALNLIRRFHFSITVTLSAPPQHLWEWIISFQPRPRIYPCSSEFEPFGMWHISSPTCFFLLKGMTPNLKKRVMLGMTLNYLGWWGHISGNLENIEYLFIDITPQGHSNQKS